MGKVFFGVPRPLALILRDKFKIKTFIETGTYKAYTSAWAATEFEQVYTVEAWEQYYQRAVDAHKAVKNLHFLFGDSRTKLPEILAQVKEPAIVWLDAHWWGDTTVSAGGPGECPLREELVALGKCGVRHFILIDDLHCFEGQLNKGAFREMWPNTEEVKATIRAALPGYYILLHEDVIIAVPPEARYEVEEYAFHSGLRFVVPTSNEYVNALNPFAYLFNKYLGDAYGVDVMRYDRKQPKLPHNYHVVAVGPQKDYSWSSGLAAYLRLPQVPPQFVMLLEDYWLSGKPDMEKLNYLWRYMQDHPEVKKIDLSGDRMKFPHSDYGGGLILSDQDAQFRASIQAAIWRKDYLLSCLERGDWSPWIFEKHGAQGDGAVILGTESPVIPYVNAIGGMGKNPTQYDHKKIPAKIWKELQGARMV